jgi:hypothetical protein
VNYRSSNSLVPKQQRKQPVSVYTVGGEMSVKNLEQQINSKFCVKTGKSGSKTLALLTLAYGEYGVKK